MRKGDWKLLAEDSSMTSTLISYSWQHVIFPTSPKASRSWQRERYPLLINHKEETLQHLKALFSPCAFPVLKWTQYPGALMAIKVTFMTESTKWEYSSKWRAEQALSGKTELHLTPHPTSSKALIKNECLDEGQMQGLFCCHRSLQQPFFNSPLVNGQTSIFFSSIYCNEHLYIGVHTVGQLFWVLELSSL